MKISRIVPALILLLSPLHCASPDAPTDLPRELELSMDDLRDKIKGGWAAQTIGVTFGGPTEFQYNGTFMYDNHPIPWYDGYLLETFEKSPGLYDDIYMDLSFVEVLDREGLDAPAQSFAEAFANAGYPLWHANQMARYNILNGIEAPASGHWLNNPHADDIDFQIEADFAGLMSPGMPNTAAKICDTVGHIMNYGDGYYGGLFVAAMYAAAFATDDVGKIVDEGLRVIPEESLFHQTITDVIGWHEENPDDWQQTWFEIQRKWAEDIGCPDGVFQTFNIDARVNAAYVVLGLLYGDGDFGKTLQVSTWAGQDSDCNPATAGGILGTALGYEGIPEFWKQGLADIEPLDFAYTSTSLNDVYELSFKHALELIEANGGEVGETFVRIRVQIPEAVPLEVSFEGHYPIGHEYALNRWASMRVVDEAEFSFDGIGFAVQGRAVSRDGSDHTIEVELYIDDDLVTTAALPTNNHARKNTPFWKYNLTDGPHLLRFKVVSPTDTADFQISRVIYYGSSPAPSPSFDSL